MVDGLVLQMLEGQHHKYGHFRLFGGLGFGLAEFGVAQMDLLQSPQVTSIFFIASAIVYALGFAGQLRLAGCVSIKSWWHESTGLKTIFEQAGGASYVMIVTQWASHGIYTGFLSVSAKSSGIPFSFVGWAVVAAIVTETGFAFLSSKALAKTRWIKPSLFIILFFTVLRWLGCAMTDTALLFVAMVYTGLLSVSSMRGSCFNLQKIFPIHLRQTAQLVDRSGVWFGWCAWYGCWRRCGRDGAPCRMLGS